MADAEFFDDALEGQIKAAFNTVEPTAEAQQRMLSNLLAYEEELRERTHPMDRVVLTNEQRIARAIEEAKAAVRAEVGLAPAGGVAPAAAAEEESTGAEGAQADENDEREASDAAQIVAAARDSAPKRKRRIRPWQIAVPAAAALVLGAVVLAVGPLSGMFGGSSAEKAASTSAPTEAVEEASLDAVPVSEEPSSFEAYSSSMIDGSSASSSDLGIEESMAAVEASSSSVEDASSASRAESSSESDALSPAEPEALENEAASEESTAAEETSETSSSATEDTSSASEETKEENWPKDYPTIVVVIGDEYRLTIDSTTSEPVEKLGSVIADAVAYNSDETASVSCTIYNYTDDDEIYLISYMGEDKYYKAHVVD